MEKRKEEGWRGRWLGSYEGGKLCPKGNGEVQRRVGPGSIRVGK